MVQCAVWRTLPGDIWGLILREYIQHVALPLRFRTGCWIRGVCRTVRQEMQFILNDLVPPERYWRTFSHVAWLPQVVCHLDDRATLCSSVGRYARSYVMYPDITRYEWDRLYQCVEWYCLTLGMSDVSTFTVCSMLKRWVHTDYHALVETVPCKICARDVLHGRNKSRKRRRLCTACSG